MIFATDTFLNELEVLAEQKKQAILHTEDTITINGTAYYVSNEGNDADDGLSPEHAWKTLARVTAEKLRPGDGVRFRRGDLFRGTLVTCPGVTYCAFGKGEKPRFYGWVKNLADPVLWSLVDAAHNIWKLNERILDCGTLVFNEGEAHCRKLIPSFIGGRFVCRDDESRDFVMAQEMTRDLDMYCYYIARMTDRPSKGQNFPVPLVDAESYGDLYLRCDRGNPGEVFSSIEALPKRNMINVGGNADVRIDNLCLKYIGAHAIAAGGHCVGLHVTNCEIGWIGGTVQHFLGTDPNYPQGGRGTVTRYGNGIEIYGGCDDYVVQNNYIYQCYDAGITHQVTTHGNKCAMKHIRYLDNLVERCVYSIEYFLEKLDGDTESYMEDYIIAGNMLRLAGYGWGQQRHNTDTPAHIKGWNYENTANDYIIRDNIFDRSAYRMLHLVAKKAESLPVLSGNTYIQSLNSMLGQYGANETSEPEIMMFDKAVDEKIVGLMKDENAIIYCIKSGGSHATQHA